MVPQYIIILFDHDYFNNDFVINGLKLLCRLKDLSISQNAELVCHKARVTSYVKSSGQRNSGIRQLVLKTLLHVMTSWSLDSNTD